MSQAIPATPNQFANRCNFLRTNKDVTAVIAIFIWSRCSHYYYYMEIGLEIDKMTDKNESCEFKIFAATSRQIVCPKTTGTFRSSLAFLVSAKLTNSKPIGHIHLITSFSM